SVEIREGDLVERLHDTCGFRREAQHTPFQGVVQYGLRIGIEFELRGRGQWRVLEDEIATTSAIEQAVASDRETVVITGNVVDRYRVTHTNRHQETGGDVCVTHAAHRA